MTAEPMRVAHIATIDATHRFLLLGQLRRLRDVGFEVSAISAPGPHAKDLEAEGIRHVAWHHATRAWNPREDAAAMRELIGILRAGGFHIAHTHNPKPGMMGRVAARIARIPVVVNTVHGYYATPEDRLTRRLPVLGLEWIGARFSDLELFQSAEDLGWAKRRGLVPAGRARLLGNGTDLERFDPSAVPHAHLTALRRKLGIPEDALVVGTIGRMVAEKGYREFFAAAREVRREMPEARFVAVGPSDPAKPDAIRQDEVSAAEPDVVFAGWREDIPDLLALMDVFVLASWREGMPRSAIEAAAMRTPMVLTDIRGCREVVRDGVEGFLVPPRDGQRLAAAIATLLRDRELRDRMGAAARRRAAERFDEGAVAGRVVEAYQSLLEEKGLSGVRIDREGLRSALIRRARVEDVPTMARLHAEVLPTGFMVELGDRFLRRLFRAHVTDPDAVAVVAERDGELIGYAAGVLSTPAFRRRFLLRHGFPAALAAAPRLLRRGILRRIFENTSYPEKTQEFPDAEWTLVGVKRGTPPGLGPEMGRGVLRGLADRGADEVKGYVASDNRAMNTMVRRMGFRLAGQISVHEGKPSNIWVIRLEKNRA